ncbi:hypothetical protein ONZ45_g1284 [Pleurotus djamor]|nr:hypothetical protein ONZ45_g1284 [Pleurotus djamor]
MPALQSLTLKASRNRNFYVPKPFPFITGSSLTSLRLKDVVFEPDIPTIPSLRKLVIVSRLRSHELSVPFMYELLGKTPNIEEAHIWGISDTFGALDERKFPPITFRSLKVLSIASKAVCERALLDLLRYPKSAIVTALYSGRFDYVRLQFLRLEALLLRLTTGPDAIFFEKMRVVLDDDESGDTNFHLELFSRNAQLPDPSIGLGVPFDGDAPKVYLDICMLVPLSQITELIISQFQPSQEWQELFSALVNLKTLSLEDVGDSWLPHLLADPATLPALKVVSYKFVSLQVAPSSGNHCHINTVPVLDTAMDTVDVPLPIQDGRKLSRIQFIKRRHDSGVPLQKLIIQDCNVTRRYVDFLKTHIVVEWDGIEQVMDIGNKCPGPHSKKYSNRYSSKLSDFDEE